MKLCKVELPSGSIGFGSLAEGQIRLFDVDDARTPRSLSELLHAPEPLALAEELTRRSRQILPIEQVKLLPPLDRQEVWAAGVTYKRSQEARERESEGAARFYDLVYGASRPELFFKAPASRVIGPGGTVRIRRDSRWSVPEPELALVVSPRLQIVGYTLGNDMSARDIEGENPLYLPQAKIYDGACALGPAITLRQAMPPLEQVTIQLRIERKGKPVFEGATSLAAMKRSVEDLVAWLGRETSFPDGVVLLTGTGIVPPDDFALAPGDEVTIEATALGTLRNTVAHRPQA